MLVITSTESVRQKIVFIDNMSQRETVRSKKEMKMLTKGWLAYHHMGHIVGYHFYRIVHSYFYHMCNTSCTTFLRPKLLTIYQTRGK